jgi:pSer/pThr/pTyr-binding forkhead associated (FHA) protein
MRFRLVPLDGGPPVDLDKDLTLVGRNEDCDIRLDHKSISKVHSVLAKTDGLILVRDLGSTNGTRVNGQRVRRAALLPNDHLAFANFRYRVKFGDEPEEPVAVVATPPPVDEADDAEHTPPDVPVAKRAPEQVIRRNALPDVYPDGSPKT